MSPTGLQYFVTFVNDYSQTTWLYLMKNRSELFSHFRAFCAEIHTQFHISVQNLRSDNAKEYIFMSNFSQSCFRMASFIKHLVLILLKMEVLKEKIDIFLKPLGLYCFKCTSLSIFGPMLFPSLVFLLIGCLPLSWIGSLRFKPSFPINLCFPLSLEYLGAIVLFGMFVRMFLNSILSH